MGNGEITISFNLQQAKEAAAIGIGSILLVAGGLAASLTVAHDNNHPDMSMPQGTHDVWSAAGNSFEAIPDGEKLYIEIAASLAGGMLAAKGLQMRHHRKVPKRS